MSTQKQQTKKSLFKSLADFQQECPIIHKDTSGFNYTYADMPKIVSVINPLLRKHGLGFTQPIEGNSIRTILFHTETGETIESVVEIPIIELAKMNVYQSFGSGVTYYRRYALSSLLGIVTDKDTDAAGEQVSSPKPKKQETAEPSTMNDVTMLKLVARYNAGEGDVFDKAAKHFLYRPKDMETITNLVQNKES